VEHNLSKAVLGQQAQLFLATTDIYVEVEKLLFGPFLSYIYILEEYLKRIAMDSEKETCKRLKYPAISFRSIL
jgi:hypothetical protein